MTDRYPRHKFARWLASAQKFEEKWRKKNQDCFAYFDGEQWTEGEKGEINERGQQATVINTIRPTIDMVCAQEVERRCDIQVVGREESDCSTADLMTALLKHVFDNCNFEYYHSRGFQEAAIGGRSWIEASVFTDEQGKDQIKVEHIPWENVYLDPYSRKPDASDARFIIKVKWVDRDVLKKLFPAKVEEIDSVFDDDYHGQEYAAQIDASDRASEDFYYDRANQRVRVCECYYTVPVEKSIVIKNERTGQDETKSIFKQEMHFVIFSDDVILSGSATDDSLNKNPLGIDIFPLVPIYCMRDRNGRPKGIVSDLMDIQDQINKLNSKFLWTVAANRVIVEEGAVRDEEAFREEMQKPDGLAIVNDGGLSRIRVDDKYRDLSYMSNHLQFLLATEQRISGVNDSMLGLGGVNERSGTMQNTRISQGAAMQTTILENMYFSKQRIALVILRMIGKFYTDYRVVRITQPNGLVDNYEFNQLEVDEQGTPTGRIINDIAGAINYDVILKKVPPFNAMRDRQLTIFAEVLKSNVIPAPIAGKMMLLLSDMPQKSDLILELENFYAAQQQAQPQPGAAPGAV